MLQAIKYATEEGNEGPFICLSDSKNLVQAIQEGDVTDIPARKAAETVQECLNLILVKPNQVVVQYITRKAVQTAHEMADLARVTGKSDKGMPMQCGTGHLNIEHSLNTKYFVFQAVE